MSSIRKTGSGPYGPQQAKPTEEAAAPKAAETSPAAPTPASEVSGILAAPDKYTAAARPPEARGKALAGSPARPKRPTRGTDTAKHSIDRFKTELHGGRKAQASARRGKVQATSDSTADEDTRKLPIPGPEAATEPTETPDRGRDERDERDQLSPFTVAKETKDREEAAGRAAFRAFPARPSELKKRFRELSRRSAGEMQVLYGRLVQARDGDLVRQAAALTRLAAELPPPLERSLAKVGLGGETIDRILALPSFLERATSLRREEEALLDRIGAALALANGLKGLVPRERLPEYLELAAPELPVARDIVRNGTAIADTSRSVGDRLAAAIDLLADVQDLIPHDGLARFLGLFAASLPLGPALVELAGTLWNEAVAAQERAEALRRFARMAETQMGAEFGPVASRLKRLRPPGDLVRNALAEPAVAPEPAATPAPPPEPEPQVPARDGEIEHNLSMLLQHVDHFSQVQNLLKSLERLDPADPADRATRRAMIGGLCGMQEAALRSVLGDTIDSKPVVGLLVEVLDKLPNEEAKAAAADLLKDLDAGAVRLFLKLSSQVSIEVLSQLFRGQDADSGLNAIGEAIHMLGDVLRNPEKTGKAGSAVFRQAVEGLQKLAEAAGEVGHKAAKTLEAVVQDYRSSGERGFESLSSMAVGEGLAAEAAQRALGDLLALGALAPQEAARGLGQRAIEALDEAARTVPTARRELERAVAAVAEQGGAALEVLRATALRTGPAGDAAQRELLSLVLKGGAAAENAYHLLVGLEETGVDALGRLRRYAMKHGEKAVDVVDWIARNPGRGGDGAVRDAVHCLKDIAEVEERIARMAVAKLVVLADETGGAAEAAAEALVEILLAGPIAAGEVIAAWKGARTRGSQRVLDTLVRLGEAGAEALRHIAEGGGELGEQAHIVVGDVFDGVLDALGSWSLESSDPER
jgi:hypothetical protein